jgi:hypothetical protein
VAIQDRPFLVGFIGITMAFVIAKRTETVGWNWWCLLPVGLYLVFCLALWQEEDRHER